MLMRPAELAAIRAGDVDLAFRRWDRPRVRVGTRMRTAVGLVEVTSVDRVPVSSLTAADARRAGAASLAALRQGLDRVHAERPVYRIGLRYAGTDPRQALREAVPDAAEIGAIGAWLDRLDRASPAGPWTRETLLLIDELPATRAPDLARRMGRDTRSFKQNVRKLKERGLTESLDIGYRLSPRGAAVLDHEGHPRRGRDRPAPAPGIPLPHLGAAATRALTAHGVVRLDQVAGLTASEVQALHGVGPYALRRLRAAMDEAGLSFRGEPDGGTDFEPYRGELVAYCYRMLGSFHEAEDLVQETMVRAWKARDRYDETRASVRTWLYRIATNVCLTALQGRARRPLPSGLVAAGSDPGAPLTPALDVPWLQPFPDARFDVEARADLRLALVAATQALPARQRAVLLLRDVLEFSAAEVATQLETTVPAVNSALQRARAALAGAGDLGEIAEPDDPRARAVVDRYVRAFEAADVPALVRLLTDDAILEMPPVPLWYRGRELYGRFMDRVFAMRGPGWRVTRLSANGQPALAAYAPRTDGGHQLHTLQVLTVARGLVAHNVVFADPRVFPAFGLPPELSSDDLRRTR